MASITRDRDISTLNFTDGKNTITVTAEALTNYNLQESNPSDPAYIYTGECTYSEYYVGTEMVGYLVTGVGDMDKENLTISDTYNGYKVVGIDARAFAGNTTMKSITIPPNVTYIGERAFASSNIKGVTFQDTDTMVVYFENPGWETPHVYYSYDDNTKSTVGYGNKMKRRGTTNIYSCAVPININTIRFNAGNDKVKTEELDISAEVESMSDCLFKTTSNNTVDGVTIYNLTYKKFSPPAIDASGYADQEHYSLFIGRGAFKGCDGLTEVNLPRRLKDIDAEAFMACGGLKSVTIPKQHRLVTVGRSAFENCTELNTVTIPDGLKNIKGSAFKDCRNLWAVPEASTLEYIDEYAFHNCPQMGIIRIGPSVSFIGRHAFSYDENAKPTGRAAIFADTQTWFVGSHETLELSAGMLDGIKLIPPTSMYGTEVTGYGNTHINASRLAVEYPDRYWHKLKKMLPPEISLSGNNLSMTDHLGVAEYFYVYLNNDKDWKLQVKV